MPDFLIAPSLLSADFARLGDEVRAVTAAGADLLHFDVMDNHYVPNLTVGPLVCAAIQPHATIPIDVHLMVKPVDRIVADFAKAGAGIVSFHPEASEHVDRTIGLIRECGCKAGLVVQSGDAARLARPHARQARPRADHVGQPGLRRPVVHPRGARQARGSRARGSRLRSSGPAAGSCSRSTAASRSTTSPRPPRPARTRSSRARRSSALPDYRATIARMRAELARRLRCSPPDPGFPWTRRAQHRRRRHRVRSRRHAARHGPRTRGSGERAARGARATRALAKDASAR